MIVVHTCMLQFFLYTRVFCLNYVQIEKATDVSQASEDWTLYMEICDVINSTEEGHVIVLFL